MTKGKLGAIVTLWDVLDLPDKLARLHKDIREKIADFLEGKGPSSFDYNSDGCKSEAFPVCNKGLYLTTRTRSSICKE